MSPGRLTPGTITYTATQPASGIPRSKDGFPLMGGGTGDTTDFAGEGHGPRQHDASGGEPVWSNIHTLTIYKIDKQQDILYGTRNYTQYFAITSMGKESERELRYICVKLNHFAVYLKLTQHCKSTILQFKKKKKKRTSLRIRSM